MSINQESPFPLLSSFQYSFFPSKKGYHFGISSFGYNRKLNSHGAVGGNWGQKNEYPFSLNLYLFSVISCKPLFHKQKMGSNGFLGDDAKWPLCGNG